MSAVNTVREEINAICGVMALMNPRTFKSEGNMHS